MNNFFEKIAIGVDAERVERFKGKEKDSHFVNRLFTSNEQEYCFSKSFPEQHLAARFCAKEATMKALSQFSDKIIKFTDIEITNLESGRPELKILGFENIQTKISLSHTKDEAIAYVMLLNEERT